MDLPTRAPDFKMHGALKKGHSFVAVFSRQDILEVIVQLLISCYMDDHRPVWYSRQRANLDLGDLVSNPLCCGNFRPIIHTQLFQANHTHSVVVRIT